MTRDIKCATEDNHLTFERIVRGNLLRTDSVPKQGYSLLCLDPGETTGVAIFKDSRLVNCCQINTNEIGPGYERIEAVIAGNAITHVVMESYRIYSWKTKVHTWAALHTPQLIGAVTAMCHVKGLPLIDQTAQVAKGFATDEKLKRWDMYIKGQRHARDAIRHGCYALLFNELLAQPKGTS